MQEFESIKVMRETRNDLNRANNAEMANIQRTVTASMKTINNISKIVDTIGLGSLPSDLQEVAYIRMNHPDIPSSRSLIVCKSLFQKAASITACVRSIRSQTI